MKQNNANIAKALMTIRDSGADKGPSSLFSGLLMLVFIAMLMLALVVGVTTYQKVAGAQFDSNDARLGKQLIANNVRSLDGKDTVRVGTGPEGRSLVLVEEVDGQTIETRIYLYENQIVQEYSFEGAPYDPEKAVKLVDSSMFHINYDSGLLTITTDQGTTDVALRSKQGDD